MKSPSHFALCLAVVFAPLCAGGADLPPGLKSQPLQARSKGDGKTLFTRLDGNKVGIDVVNKMNVKHPMSFLYHSGMTTGGVAVGDFDGDGKPDIFFAGTTMPSRLYRQVGKLGEMKYADITKSAGPIDGGGKWATGASVADVNGDGRLDIYVGYYEKPNELFLNMGPGPKGEPGRSA